MRSDIEIHIILLALTWWAFAVPASAQWIHYPTPGVPKLADGRPNLSAPAPRMADGKPDFSGLWQAEKNRSCPRDGCADREISLEFANIGWSLKDGLPFQPWAAEVTKTRTAQLSIDEPSSHCLPLGMVKMHTSPDFRKIVQVQGLLVILHERNASYRQIFTDGRPLPENPNPSWNGYSTAKWEGDALVVETTGLRELWLDVGGSPITEAARIAERFRRPNYGTIEIEMTVNDPRAYTKLWTVKLNYSIALDTDLLDYICLENEKDIAHLLGK